MPTPTCTTCGFQAHPDHLPGDHRGILAVVDELGSAVVCTWCALQILVHADTGQLQVTLMLARPAGVAA